MTFGDAIRTCFSKYATFSGRARRPEFWWFMLFLFVGGIVLSIVDSVMFGTTVVTSTGFSASTDTPILSGLFHLATLLPAISVAVRRLHDLDRSGWWWWLFLVPIIGAIVLIIWFASKGTAGENAYGPAPRNGERRNSDVI